MKRTYNITAFNTGGANIPKVNNINLDNFGILTITEPDVSKLEGKQYKISYLLNINNNIFVSESNVIDALQYLNEGDNEINVKVVLELTDENGNNFTSYFDYIPYTDVSLLNLYSLTASDVGSYYAVTGYTGNESFINIPEKKGDIKILSLIGCDNVKQVIGKHIIYCQLYSWDYDCSHVTKLDLPNLTDVSLRRSLKNCSSLVNLVAFNTQNTTTLEECFYNCSSLTKIPSASVEKCENFTNAFYGCVNLKSILLYGFKASFDISVSTKFEREDLVTILNNLGTVSETQTLTMGSTNLAKLTSEDKAIATNKGWVLA